MEQQMSKEPNNSTTRVSNSPHLNQQTPDASVMQMINKLRGDEKIAGSAMLATIALVLQGQYNCNPDEVFKFLGEAETTRKLIEAYRSQDVESTPSEALTCPSARNVSAQASPSHINQDGLLNDQERKRLLIRTYGGLNPSTSNSIVQVANKEITDSNVVQPMTHPTFPSARSTEASIVDTMQVGPSSLLSVASTWRNPFPFPPSIANPPPMDLTPSNSHYLVQHDIPLRNVAPTLHNPHYIRHASNHLPNAPLTIQRPNYQAPGIDFNVPGRPLSDPRRPYMGGGQVIEDSAAKRMRFFRPPGQQ